MRVLVPLVVYARSSRDQNVRSRRVTLSMASPQDMRVQARHSLTHVMLHQILPVLRRFHLREGQQDIDPVDPLVVGAMLKSRHQPFRRATYLGQLIGPAMRLDLVDDGPNLHFSFPHIKTVRPFLRGGATMCILRTSAETPMASSHDIKRITDLTKRCGMLLYGNKPEIQGAVLADLLAIWLAGHPAPLRDEILKLHIEHVWPLVATNAKRIGT